MAAISVILVIHLEFPVLQSRGEKLHTSAKVKACRMLRCAVDRFLSPMDDGTRLRYRTLPVLQTFPAGPISHTQGGLL